VKGLWASNVSWLNVGTDYAAQTVVAEVFRKHRRLILRNLSFLSRKSFPMVLVPFSSENSTMVSLCKRLNMIPISWIPTMVGSYASGRCMRWMLTVYRKGPSRILVKIFYKSHAVYPSHTHASSPLFSSLFENRPRNLLVICHILVFNELVSLIPYRPLPQ